MNATRLVNYVAAPARLLLFRKLNGGYKRSPDGFFHQQMGLICWPKLLDISGDKTAGKPEYDDPVCSASKLFDGFPRLMRL
jgi:hypothetical protein